MQDHTPGDEALKSEDVLERKLKRLQKLLPLRKAPRSEAAEWWDGDASVRGSVPGGMPGAPSGSSLFNTFKDAVSRSRKAGGDGSHHRSSTLTKSYIGAFRRVRGSAAGPAEGGRSSVLSTQPPDPGFTQMEC